MIPSLTDSDDTVCDDADELNQLCEMFYKRSWPPREQQDDAENPSPEMKTLLPSEPNWQPDWALDGLGDGLDRGWPSMDARVAIDGQACFTDRTRVQAQRLTGPAGPIIATGMVDDGNSSTDAADSADEPVQTGILVACKSPDPQTGTSFSQRALHVITKCQDVLERNASGEHDVLLREIDELKKRFCGPVLLRAHARHRRFALTNDSKRVLKQWFNDHLEHPYPTQREKEVLARSASLSVKQINDWFTNYRKRHWEADLIDAQYPEYGSN